MKKNVIAAASFGALLLIVGGYWIGKSQSNVDPSKNTAAAQPGAPTKTTRDAAAAPAAIAVEATIVKSVRMAQGLTAVGSLRSDESVTIRPEVSGRISEIGFRRPACRKRCSADSL